MASTKAMSRKSAPRRWFLVHPSYRSAVLGIDLENENRLRGNSIIFAADAWNPGFPDYPETPRFRHDKKEGRLPRDLDAYSGYWLVSARMKALMQSLDHEAFAFVRCDFFLADGKPGPELWLCDVIRVLDALDPVASAIDVEMDGTRKMYKVSLAANQTLVFREDVVRDAHVFRIAHCARKIACDETFRAACKAEDLKNVEFLEVTKLK